MVTEARPVHSFGVPSALACSGAVTSRRTSCAIDGGLPASAFGITRVESTGTSSSSAGSASASQAMAIVMIRCPRGRSTVNSICSPNGAPAPPDVRPITASFFAKPQISRPATSGISLSVKMNGW
jgi:hypothetical protein